MNYFNVPFYKPFIVWILIRISKFYSLLYKTLTRFSLSEGIMTNRSEHICPESPAKFFIPGQWAGLLGIIDRLYVRKHSVKRNSV
jgi:hypothetical protein